MSLVQKQSLVTVGVPCYNRPDGLRKALDCICNQTYRKLDILISDNASPDPELKRVAESYMALDSRVRYVRQEKNLGPLPNFLFLAEKAQGDFFMWAADDDWWDTEFIEQTVAQLEGNQDAAVAFTYFAPIENEFSKSKRYPDFYKALSELTASGQYERMSRFICQRDAYGKAHIIYGLFRRKVLQKALAQTIKNVSRITDVNDLGQFDMLLNAAVLSLGRLVVCKRLLRRFGSGPRKVPRPEQPTFWERVLRYDKRTLIYYDCYIPLIEDMQLHESQKQSLQLAVRKKKFYFILERIGRRLFVYKIYWHFVKKFTFKRIE